MTNKYYRLIAVVVTALGLCMPADAGELVRVAYDDAGVSGVQPHLVSSDGDWRCPNPGTSDEALRTVAFGTRIEFGYQGLNPQAVYRAKLRFFTDSHREVRVKAGDVTILASVVIEIGKLVEREVDIPSVAYASGKLALVIEHIAGHNGGVVSDVEILSTDPKPLASIPLPSLVLPRLSPRPVRVTGVSDVYLDFGGKWQFNPAPAADWQSQISTHKSQITQDWAQIQVPGEWAMQGFEVKPGTAAGYRRTFKIPSDWSSKRIKLRSEGVYSDATVWINGKMAGCHQGGFTPFELDVTDFVRLKGENAIVLAVINESKSDKLASGTRYACHQLGGIPRNIKLFVLPAVSLSSLQVTTTFDTAFRDATLGVSVNVVNEGPTELSNVSALLSLVAPDGRAVKLSPDSISLGTLAAGRQVSNAVSISVMSPLKWDNEHPNLYTLKIKLNAGRKTQETLVQKIGFRQVQVRGNRLFVNNMPVKLHGINRHEVYPVTGRCVPAGIHRQDVELFREANVNLLRTCHYPPAEALMEAADELGMFIECEAPFCWAPGSGNKNLVSQETAEMILTYRNHPSVLFWSLANESGWGADFVESSKLVRKLDPTRPQTFNNPGDQKFTEIANLHYPGHGGPAEGRKSVYPVYLGEDCHLNAYNRLELATDPALRDKWGIYTRELWDEIYDSEGCLGQSIWSGVDDTFYLKDDQTVGYGTWGPIDGWRRPKPEYWGMKKAYSPVRILNAGTLAVSNNVIEVNLQNRQNFSDMGEMKVAWKVGSQSGKAAASIAPRSNGILRISLKKAPASGDRLELKFTDSRGFVADEFRLSLTGFDAGNERGPAVGSTACTMTESAESIAVDCGSRKWKVSKTMGRLEMEGAAPGNIQLSGPQLMILPLNGTGENQMTGKTKVWTPFTEPCTGWGCSKVVCMTDNGKVKVTVTGKYDWANGGYTYIFKPGGCVEVAYEFTVSKDLNPRQVGLVFSLPRGCEVFSWDRKGYWDVYPDDHIARLCGTVRASEGFEATSVGSRTKPSHPWRLDNLPYGNNDFCSTKHNIVRASLLDARGNGVEVDGQGRQHMRCWRTAERVSFLVADYSNGGSEGFLRGLASKDDRCLKVGDKVSGVVRLMPVLDDKTVVK